MNSNTITAPVTTDNEILKLFGLDKQKVKELQVYHQKDGVHVQIQLMVVPHICPVCGNCTTKIRGYQRKVIKHSILNHDACFIDYDARRYECRKCHKTFYEHNPFTMNGMKISLATVYNILEDLKRPAETFTSVAQRYHVSPTSVTHIFDRHVHVSRKKLPEYMGIDEVYAFRSYRSKYVCVLVDFKTKDIIDVLPSRKKADLLNYFSIIPRQEREKVKMVSFDFWETYRLVSNLMFPHSKNSVDHFHLIQELNRRVDKVRIRIMNHYYQIKKKEHNHISHKEEMEIKEAAKYYYVFKKFNWLLFKNDNRILNPNEEKRYNMVLEGYYNYYDLLDFMLQSDKDLEMAYNIKYDIDLLYRTKDIATAKVKLEEIITDIRSCPIKELSSFANTLSKWKTEILNSFLIVDTQIDKKTGKTYYRRMNTSMVENRNKSIKLLKHSSNGYLNWSRFRNRILYTVNSDVTYYMYPTFEKENQQ